MYSSGRKTIGFIKIFNVPNTINFRNFYLIKCLFLKNFSTRSYHFYIVDVMLFKLILINIICDRYEIKKQDLIESIVSTFFLFNLI